MSSTARAAIVNNWKKFGTVGAVSTALSQYHAGYEGKEFEWADIGPQAIPKFLGRLHHGHNLQKELEGNWERSRAYHQAIADTPPLRTNIRFLPNLSSLDHPTGQ